MNPRGKSVKRGGLARICMQIRCFHYRSTITEREMERERERRAATRKYADNAWPLFGGREGRGEHGFLPRSEIQARI